MKNFLLFTFIITAQQLFAQSGIGIRSPNSQAQLHIESTDKGVLIPRIKLLSLENKAPIINSNEAIVESLLVYNNNETGIPKGYYYWSDNKWNKIIMQQDIDRLALAVVTQVSHSLTNEGALITTVNGIKSDPLRIGGGAQIWNKAEGIAATDSSQDIYRSGAVSIGRRKSDNDKIKLEVSTDALINGITVGKGNSNIYSNTAIGYQALYKNTGWNNTANGYLALYSNESGGYNIANGGYALYSNKTGSSNVANGYAALYLNSAGDYNIANGYAALYSNTIGSNNIASGYEALYSNTTGTDNIASGYEALWINTTGKNNIAIGKESGPTSGNLDNTICIGHGAKTYKKNTIRLGNNRIENIYAQVSISPASDRRYKENIETIPLGLEFINKVRPVEYIRKNNEEKTKEWGVIAQELRQTLVDIGYKNSGIVQEDKSQNHYLSVRYNDLIAPMIKAIQELSKKEKELKKKNEELKKENEELKKKDDQIEGRISELETMIRKN